ncbi:hypothetical protein RJ55_00863 [Drechmeria coniospora]|nr:hypothetical protein RJ55_00863 [Drechmeria coniospora]
MSKSFVQSRHPPLRFLLLRQALVTRRARHDAHKHSFSLLWLLETRHSSGRLSHTGTVFATSARPVPDAFFSGIVL